MEDTPKDVLARLGKLKSNDSNGNGSLESKMPARAENQEIKIPVPMPKRSSSVGDLQNRPLMADGKEMPVAAKPDDSIFGGTGISRRTLKRGMVTDPEIKKAARLTKLGLSPTERANIVKDVFPKVYGGNISERDLKRGVKKLGKEMRSTNPSSNEHRVIRKEIKFLKKIGGL